MSVLIKGMEMPSCCMFCPISNFSGCGLMNPPVLMTSKEMLADRPDWCPLIEVKPHGRLIDADALYPIYADLLDGGDVKAVVPKSVIDTSPTIIEAEEGE